MYFNIICGIIDHAAHILHQYNHHNSYYTHHLGLPFRGVRETNGVIFTALSLCDTDTCVCLHNMIHMRKPKISNNLLAH